MTYINTIQLLKKKLIIAILFKNLFNKIKQEKIEKKI